MLCCPSLNYLFVESCLAMKSILQLESIAIITAHKCHLEQCQNMLHTNLATKRFGKYFTEWKYSLHIDITILMCTPISQHLADDVLLCIFVKTNTKERKNCDGISLSWDGPSLIMPFDITIQGNRKSDTKLKVSKIICLGGYNCIEWQILRILVYIKVIYMYCL